MISNSSSKQCALPSIRSLLLDMPEYQGYQQANYLPQHSNFSPPQGPNYSLPPLYRLTPYSGYTTPVVPQVILTGPGREKPSYILALPHLVSPISSPYSRVQSVDPVASAYGRNRASSDTSVNVLSPPTTISRGSVDDISHDITVSAAPSLAQFGGFGYDARSASGFNSAFNSASTDSGSSIPIPSMAPIEPTTIKKNWKPRKKRQCPECKLFYSNLATHKSTHLQPTSRPHICKYCSRGFARPNDLFRHVKCHWKEIGSDKGQFKCPFKVSQESTPPNSEDESTDHCCHNTGIFSRCDTFKNHLKAIHFQYPTGTKKDQRMKVRGKCRMCQEEFSNVDEWLSKHIDGDRCPAMVNKTS